MALFFENDDESLGGPLDPRRFRSAEPRSAPLSASATSASSGMFGSQKRYIDKSTPSGLGQLVKTTRTTDQATTTTQPQPTTASLLTPLRTLSTQDSPTYTKTVVAPTVDEQESSLLDRMRQLVTTAPEDDVDKVRVDAPTKRTRVETPEDHPEQRPTQDLILPSPSDKGTAPAPPGMGPETLVSYQPAFVPEVPSPMKESTKWLIGSGVAVAALVTAVLIFRR